MKIYCELQWYDDNNNHHSKLFKYLKCAEKYRDKLETKGYPTCLQVGG